MHDYTYNDAYNEVSKNFNRLFNIYNNLINSYKFTPEQAVGIVSNISVESGGNPGAKNGQFYGLTQLSPIQQNFIRNKYGSLNLRSQLNYLANGMKGNINTSDKNVQYELNQLNKVLKNTNKRDSISVTKGFQQYHERNGMVDQKKRILHNKAFRNILLKDKGIKVAQNIFNPNVELEQNYFS